MFTVVLGKPVTQLIQTFCKGRKASLLVLCPAIGIRDTDTGKYPGFVNVQSTAVFAENFESHLPPSRHSVWGGSAGTGHPAKSSRFERDKFTGYLFAPFVDALTDDRRHIEMRGCRYTAPPLTSTGSVVYRTLRGYCNKFCKCTKGRRFHNHVGAFRRKADYTQMKRGMKSCCPLVSDECCFYDAT